MEMNKLDNNFEKLKQSMLQKKLKAEAVNKNVSGYVDSDRNKDGNIIVNKNEDKDVCDDVNINVYKDVNKTVYNSDYNSENKSENNNVNNIGNKYVIKPKELDEALVRYSLYLKPETIKKIGHFSVLLNMGKSELVRKILEDAFENLEII
ncbi:MAG: hypothetical protein GX660_12980 [Clostridiaceae bacterium]|nr:hypothetical protein [Clostridiaceae bacterium]